MLGHYSRYLWYLGRENNVLGKFKEFYNEILFWRVFGNSKSHYKPIPIALELKEFLPGFEVVIVAFLAKYHSSKLKFQVAIRQNVMFPLDSIIFTRI